MVKKYRTLRPKQPKADKDKTTSIQITTQPMQIITKLSQSKSIQQQLVNLQKQKQISRPKMKHKVNQKSRNKNSKNNSKTNKNKNCKQEVPKQVIIAQRAQQNDNVKKPIEIQQDSIQQIQEESPSNDQIQANNQFHQHVGFNGLVGQNIPQKCKSLKIQGQTWIHLLPFQQFLKVTVPNFQNLKHGSQNLNMKLNIALAQYQNVFFINNKVQKLQCLINKPTIFKIQRLKQTKTKNMKLTELIKKVSNNLVNIFKCSQNISQLEEFLHDFHINQHAIVVSNKEIQLSMTSEPFKQFPYKILDNKNSTLILGVKNSGKSTLAQFVRNLRPEQVCILDCDIGRNLIIPACISLITPNQNSCIWVGQYTPLNCINSYKRAIEYLYSLYRQKHFTKKLIINTMGYITGLGEILLYEIYNIINPTEVIILSNDNWSQSKQQNIDNIIFKIKSGQYHKNLLFNSQNKSYRKKLALSTNSLEIYKLNNPHSQTKGVPVRFQNLLKKGENIRSIYQLVKSIKKRQFKSITNLEVFQQDKIGNLTSLEWNGCDVINMRIVLLCKFLQNTKNDLLRQCNEGYENIPFIQVLGVGFGFQGKIYYDQRIISEVISPQVQDLKACHPIGLLCEGIDFQKYFYQISQSNLIKLELEYGAIPYIAPIIKGLGTKGLRNNSSRKG